MRPALRCLARIAALATLLTACQTTPPPPPPPPAPAPPPPDVDGSPIGAVDRSEGAVYVDGLDRAQNDLDDWHRFEIPGPGSFRVQVSGPEGAPLMNLVVSITDSNGVSTAPPTRSGGRPRLDVSAKVAPGTQLVWVGTEADSTAPIAYELLARFTPEPKPRPRRAPPPPPQPPPPPAVDVFTTRVVEIAQGKGDSQFATIAGGERAGMRPGLRGRLKDGGKIIGTFEIVDVYAAGSRVRIDGRLSSPVTGETTVEVDVPR